VNGFVTFLVRILAGSEERLPLPFKFVEAMEGLGLARAIVEECSGDYRMTSRSSTTMRGSATSATGGPSSSRTTT
jgi:hypothetical protein